MSDYTPTTEEVANDYECVDDEETFSSDVYKVRAERRQRFYVWLAAHDAEVRAAALAEQGEVEWEYGTRCPMPECTEPHLLDEGDGPPQPEESLWRRTKARDVPAGEWMPVPDTTGDESQGKA